MDFVTAKQIVVMEGTETVATGGAKDIARIVHLSVLTHTSLREVVFKILAVGILANLIVMWVAIVKIVVRIPAVEVAFYARHQQMVHIILRMVV